MSGYDGGLQDRLLERTGWLHSELNQLKSSMLTKADLLEFAAEMDRQARDREERREKKMQDNMDRAFAHGVPGTIQLVRSEVAAIQKQDQEQFEDSLKRAGLEYKDDGNIGPKIHPIRRAAVKNTQFVLFAAGVAAAANPEQTLSLARLLMAFLKF